ncbi:MAG: hypothetical protein J6I69_01920 [Bacilli bacterium]|nr:hypothetical protein [Bacilli bacterium]
MENLYLLDVSFSGLKYKGSQRLTQYPSIQKSIENALKKVYSQDIKTKLSSRVDAQVSALHMGVTFFEKGTLTPDKIKYVLNRALEDDIRVNEVKIVPPSFDIRKDVKSKTYLYLLNLENENPLLNTYAFHPFFKVNLDKLKESLSWFKGQHDFTAFISMDEEIETPFKIIEDTSLEVGSPFVKIRIKGHSFGRYQVRYIVGTCLYYSCGKVSKEDIISRLEGRNKEHLGYKVPGKGLILECIEYDESKLC